MVKGQGNLMCCSPWGCEESDTTGQLNNSHPERCKVISHCDFDLLFPDWLVAMSIFPYTYWPFVIF